MTEALRHSRPSTAFLRAVLAARERQASNWLTNAQVVNALEVLVYGTRGRRFALAAHGSKAYRDAMQRRSAE